MDNRIENRKEFFFDIVKKLQEEPSVLEELFEQHIFYYAPPVENRNSCINDPDNAQLYLNFTPSFYGKSFDFSYIIFNPGVQLWISILLNDKNSRTVSNNNSFQVAFDKIWESFPNYSIEKSDYKIRQWRFNTEELLFSEEKKEYFILLIRKMHICLLESIFEYAKKNSCL